MNFLQDYLFLPMNIIYMRQNNWDINHASYASMIFKYAYDSRGRMTSKTVPSGGTTSIAYDRLDRPVLSTDAKSFKTFTRYDILGRPIVSGKYKGAGSPGATDPLFETSNTTAPHYYTSTSFPTDNNLDVYKVFYYDDYDLDNNGSLGATETYTNPAESGYDVTAFLRTRGKPTASKVGILLSSGLAPTNFLTTRTYYDKEYSVIQVNKQNHLGGADISSSAYDFANRVTKTRRDHTAIPPGGSLKTYYIREEFTYDAASRLRFTRHHISTTAGVPTAGWVVTAAPLYDELGRLLDKRLHASNYNGSSPLTLNSSFTYLQSLDYTYNIRGWLTGINDPTICTAQTGDDAIDLFRMSLEYESTANGGTAQYNGNISTIQWNTYINGTCGTRHLYRFGYDFSNRLTAANYRARVGATWVDQSKYTENNITYDFNGNLKTYFRRGDTGASQIDNLNYTYGDATRPDRLTNMVDAGDAAKGFKYTSGAADYQYDLNGNMTQDNHKGFTFAYNYLNLPQTMTQGANVITLTYTADGEKLTKSLSGGGTTKSYVSGIEYSGTGLEAIYFSEGRCTPNGASAFYYDYTIKDHLGNARENFRASGGTAITHLEDMHYYPFGMLMEGMGTNSPTNDYAYNGKELNEDFGLNLSDYGARWYDAGLGRWWSVDPLGEKYLGWSPYNYGVNDPIRMVDLDGRKTEDYVLAINHDNQTITVKATYYVQRGNAEATASANQATEFWNAQSGNYSYNIGKKDNVISYAFNFELNVVEVDNPASAVENDRISDKIEGAEPKITPDQSSNAYSVNSDEHAIFKSSDEGIQVNGATRGGVDVHVRKSKSNSDTGAHEVGHTLGLKHFGRGIMTTESNSAGYDRSIKGTYITEIISNAFNDKVSKGHIQETGISPKNFDKGKGVKKS